MEEILRVENLFLDFGGIQALSDVSLGINKGEIFSIIGPNGAGRTSLFNSISGFYRLQKGTIYFQDVNITKLPSYHLSPVGFMFDDGLRAVGATVIPTGVGNTEIQVQVINNVKVTGFVGPPSFLTTLRRACTHPQT